MALDLAARRAGERAAREQPDPLDGKVEGRGHRAPDGGGHRGVVAVDLHVHAEALGPVELHPEGRDLVGADGRVAARDGLLDVLRVVVGAGEDDHVLHAADDVHVAPVEESEVAGGRAVGEGVGAAPVAVGHVVASDPELADAALGEGPVGADDADAHAAERGPPAHHGLAVGGGGDLARAEARGVDAELAVAAEGVVTAHLERRLGETVAGVEGRATEANRAEGAREGVERPRAHKLRTDARHLPGRQVEACQFLGADARGGEGEAEVETGLIVARKELTARSQAAGRRRKVLGDMNAQWEPCHTGGRILLMSPRSCWTGSQLT